MSEQTIGINIEDVELAGTAGDVLGANTSSELSCPTIPGVTFPSLPVLPSLPALPDLTAIGAVFLNPPSPSDLINGLANKGSSAADKLLLAIDKAANDIAAQVQANLVAEWDKTQIARDNLAGAFAGFKTAAECLTGAPGSAAAESNATAGKLSEGLAEGNGLSATAASEAKTSQNEDTTDENGNKVKKKKTISPEEARAAVEGTTKTPVPQSAEPIVSYQYVSRVA